MKRLALTLGVVALLGLSGLAGAQDDASPIKKVMGKLHNKQKGVLPAIGASLKTGSPDWAEIKKASKVVVDLSESITDLEPPKGEKANFNKLSKAYLAEAKNLHEAAETEDAAKTGAALKKLFATCKTCHTAHKGQ